MMTALRKSTILFGLVIYSSSAQADVQCVFGDQEIIALRNMIEVLTGSARAPAGGIENARLGVFIDNKLRSCPTFVPTPTQKLSPPATDSTEGS